MWLLEKFSTKNYLSLKILLVFFILGIIIIVESFNYYFFTKNIINILFDIAISLFLSILVIWFMFYIIKKKETQLNEQVKQLTDAYQYIGQINRKIDALLELDISTLDHSTEISMIKSYDIIFNQLISLVQAQAGFLYLKPPFNFKIRTNKITGKGFKNIFNRLLVLEGIDFKYSKHNESTEFFKALDISDDYLKKYNFVTKPVYMHNQDIGVMLLIFNANQPLEERDFNMIRVFSFYLALNATFKPDFSIYQA